jgi:hypothetical protein
MFAMIAVPAVCAREKDPRRGMRKMVNYMLWFAAFYGFSLIFLYGRV